MINDRESDTEWKWVKKKNTLREEDKMEKNPKYLNNIQLNINIFAMSIYNPKWRFNAIRNIQKEIIIAKKN